jgi:AcrR family transcriptional regulator
MTSGSGVASESLRDAQKRLTRQRLVDAARVVFAEKGFTEATVDDIVDRAGASRGTFYLYYKGKSEILADLFTLDYLEPVFDLFDQFPQHPLTKQGLETWIEQFIDLYRDKRWTMQVWMLADSLQPALRGETTRMLDEILDRLGTAIAKARRDKGKDATRQAQTSAFLLFSQIEQYCYFTVLREYPLDTSTAVKALSTLWLPVLSGKS